MVVDCWRIRGDFGCHTDAVSSEWEMMYHIVAVVGRGEHCDGNNNSDPQK